MKQVQHCGGKECSGYWEHAFPRVSGLRQFLADAGFNCRHTRTRAGSVAGAAALPCARLLGKSMEIDLQDRQSFGFSIIDAVRCRILLASIVAEAEPRPKTVPCKNAVVSKLHTM